MFWDGVEQPGASDFVVSEAAFGCASAGNSIGTVLGFAPFLGSGYRFQLERFVNNSQAWVTAANYNGFVPLAGVPFAPGTPITGPSEVDGYQGEIQMGTAYFGAFDQFPSAEWVAFNNTWVGYFPSSMFGPMGCSVEFYGEAYDVSSTTTSWMSTDMGSGNRPWSSSAYDNFQQAGYIRQPYYLTSPAAQSWTLITANSAALLINHRYCYDGRWTTDGGSGWNPTLWLGGPGGNGTGCNADPGGSFGLRNGAFVCSPGCSQCTGSGCGSAGGPGDVCCGGTINSGGWDCMDDFAPCKIKTADPECRTGVLHSTGQYCCGAGCTQCGGSGCGGAGTGCCVGGITALCSGSMPPCKIDPPPPVP